MQCPTEPGVMAYGVIIEKAELGGLHQRYEQVAAKYSFDHCGHCPAEVT
jgi:hypothetical protein